MSDLKSKAAGRVDADSIRLMHQLARMAGVEPGLYHKMVLVLDPHEPPLLYGEQFLVVEKQEDLEPVALKLEEKAVIVEMVGGITVAVEE